MDYFYAHPEYITRDTVEITGEEFNRLVHVTRKNEGDVIRVVDGKGHAYDVTLSSIKKKIALGRILARYANHNESDLTVHLVVGVLKNPSKFDFLVEKVTELGIKRIIPMITERTIPHHAKTERWQKLALAAMKQCGRSFLPRVEKLQTLSNVLQTVRSYDAVLLYHESVTKTQTIGEFLRKASSSERPDASILAGCVAVSLGPRRLRTKTAAITAAALVLQS